MSVHIGVILDNNNNKICYTNLPTGLCKINLTIEILIISIIQNFFYVVTIIEVISVFLK